MDYLLKASGLVILLFLFYQLFLKNETFFKSIRFYFLIGLLIVVSIPLIEIPVYIEAVTTQLNLSDFQEIASPQIKIIEESFDWIQLATFIYLLGVVLFSLKFIVQLVSLFYLIISHKSIKQGNHYCIETTKDISPFSFFNYIVFNSKQLNATELEQIINHEKAHVIQWHSLDTILAHLLVITLWFNPFVWLYKKAVQQNLEFLADSYALQQTDNEKFYQLTLLKMFQQNYCTQITNNFYNSLIKKRITMLQKNRSTTKNQWKYAMIVPLLAVFVFAFNTKTIAQEKEQIEVVEIQNNNLEIITKNTQKSNLEAIKQRLKSQDIDFSYSSLKYNNENELTKITVKLKNDNGKVSATWGRKGKTIPIIYVGKKNGELIASSSPPKEHTTNYVYTIHSDENQEHNGAKKVKHVIMVDTVDTLKGNITYISKAKVIGYYNDSISNRSGRTDSLKGNITYISKAKVIGYYNDSISNRSGRADTLKWNTKMIIGKDFDIDEDNASENIFIVKKNGKLIQKKIGHNVMAFSTLNGKEKPLFIVNGKQIAAKAVNKIPSENIYSISILKNDDAIKTYGKKGKNGVVNITLKNSERPQIVLEGKPLSYFSDSLLIIKDGKEISQEEMEKINPNAIKSFEILKGDKAVEKYGKKAKDGVIIITLKK